MCLSVIPILGDVLTAALPSPKNCSDKLQYSAESYQETQQTFVRMCSEFTHDFEDILNIFTNIDVPAQNASDGAHGLLPDALRAALQPSQHRVIYMSIISLATFFCLLGVVLTL